MSAGHNPMIHPDENLLAAFAERALAGAERESVLSHLSSCARCRAIVFLAQESDAQAEAAAQISIRPARRRWLRWQAATAAAWVLALAIATALLWHSHRMSSALNEQAILHPAVPPATTSAGNSPLAKTPPAPPPPPPPEFRAPAKQEPADKKTAPVAKGLGWGANVSARRLAPQSGMLAQGYVAPPAGAPQEQKAIATGELRSLPTQGRQVVPQASQSVTVQAAPSPITTESAPAMFPSSNALQAAKPEPPASRQLTTLAAPLSSPVNAPLRSPQFSVAKGKLERLDDASRTTVALPLGARARAVAAHGSTVLLLTRQRTLYRSTDSGEHWTTVPVQWSGKPVAVSVESQEGVSSDQILARDRVAGATNQRAKETQASPAVPPQPAGSDSALSSKPPVAKAVGSEPFTVTFELVNGAGKRWWSRDGGESWQPE